MNPVIPEPAADAPIIDWAKPVTRALTALADRTGAAARNERGAALPKLRPWEIHFFPAQTQEDEDFWGVYLPAGSLNVAGEEVTPTDSSGTALAEAGTAYPGYYIIPVASETSPSAFWLHVYTSEGTGGTSYRATVGASARANAGSGEETLTSIRLCSIASSGAITQLIVGAIALGGGDSGGGSGGGDVSVGTPKTAATSIEYTDGYDASHPYAIKLTRGYLAANANVLTVEPQTGGGEAVNLTQYIDTVPITSVVVPNALFSAQS